MNVQIRFHGVERTPELAEHATRRAHHHLSRFGRQVSSLQIRLTDLNGPRGGRDKRWRLTARGPRIGTLSLHETHDDLYVGLDSALDRASRAIGRSIERARGLRSTVDERS